MHYYEIVAPCKLTATLCNTLQHSATHCNTLQTRCNTLQPAACHRQGRLHRALLWNRRQSAAYSLRWSGLFCRSLLLQHPATHCNTLHTATHCNTLQHTATHCNALEHTATHWNTLQHTATHCNTLQHIATHCNTLIMSSSTISRIFNDVDQVCFVGLFYYIVGLFYYIVGFFYSDTHTHVVNNLHYVDQVCFSTNCNTLQHAISVVRDTHMCVTCGSMNCRFLELFWQRSAAGSHTHIQTLTHLHTYLRTLTHHFSPSITHTRTVSGKFPQRGLVLCPKGVVDTSKHTNTDTHKFTHTRLHAHTLSFSLSLSLSLSLTHTHTHAHSFLGKIRSGVSRYDPRVL